MNHGLFNVCMFSNSLQVVQAATHPGDELGSIGSIALEIRSLIKYPSFLSLQHIKKRPMVLKKALNLGWTKLITETNAIQVVKAIPDKDMFSPDG